MVRIITYIKHLFANRTQQEHYIHILSQMNLWEVDLLTLSDEIYLFQFLIDNNVLTLNDSFNNGAYDKRARILSRFGAITWLV